MNYSPNGSSINLWVLQRHSSALVVITVQEEKRGSGVAPLWSRWWPRNDKWRDETFVGVHGGGINGWTLDHRWASSFQTSGCTQRASFSHYNHICLSRAQVAPDRGLALAGGWEPCRTNRNGSLPPLLLLKILKRWFCLIQYTWELRGRLISLLCLSCFLRSLKKQTLVKDEKEERRRRCEGGWWAFDQLLRRKQNWMLWKL